MVGFTGGSRFGCPQELNSKVHFQDWFPGIIPCYLYSKKFYGVLVTRYHDLVKVVLRIELSDITFETSLEELW